MVSLDREEVQRVNRTKKESSKVFHFGETQYSSRGVIEIPVVVKRKKFYLITEIIQGDVPWLIGKNAMGRMGMHLDIKRNKARIEAFGDMEVMLREDERGHLRMTMREIKEEKVMLEGWREKNHREIKRDVEKLHLQFGHGSGGKIWSLLEEAQWTDGVSEEKRNDMKKMVMEVIANCKVCAKYKRNPAKPVVGFPWSKTFNETIAVDLGEIEGRRFLVMVDMMTRYCQAKWLKDKRPDSIMKTLIDGWFALFGAPCKILSDNGGEFQNEKMRIMTERWNIKVITTPAESPWSNGLCEKTVGLLKESLRKMRDDEEIDLDMALRWVVSARNCLVNNGGFSPNQLVFGKNPSLPNLVGEESSSPASREKGWEEKVVRDNLNAMHKARETFVRNESCNKIRKALNSQVREHKFEEAKVGDEVFYKRENEKEWRGPAIVVGVVGKTVIVKHGDSLREIARVHITRIQGKKGCQEKTVTREPQETAKERVMREPQENVEETEDVLVRCRRVDQEQEETAQEPEIQGEQEENPEVAEEMEIEEENSVEEIPKLKKGNRIRARNQSSGNIEEWTVLGPAGKKSSKKWSDSYNVQDSMSGEKGWVDLKDYSDIERIEDEEEVLLGFEDRKVIEAKEKELQSWMENDVYEEVDDIGQKAISTRWIVTEKIKGEEKICKARLVARGFEEEMAEWEKDAPTCNAETLKFCLATMKIKKWACYSLDVKTAYLQGDQIQREVYLKPPREGGWNGLWKLKKTVYGLKDAAKAWYIKVVKVVEELGGVRSRLEPNIFYWKKEERLEGILCTHVDDFCYGGTEQFLMESIGRLREKLKVGEQESKKFKYIGVNVEQKEDRICINQWRYVSSIQEPDASRFRGNRVLNAKELTEYRSVVGQLNWIALHTMPEIAYSVSDLSKAFKEGTSEDMRKLIKTVRRVKSIMGGVTLNELEEKEIYWEAYADASFGNIEDGHTQLGYIIALTDGKKRCPIWWKSRKSRRVAKSTIEAEALSVGEVIEGVIYFNRLWEEVVGGRKLEAVVKTDSKTLMTAIKSSTGVSSKRLKIDMAAIKETLEAGEITEVQWVQGKHQIADVLTKSGVSEENIRDYIENGDRKHGV